MTISLIRLHQALAGFSIGRLRGLALLGVLGMGLLDIGSGYEVSVGLFYLGPVALAAWFGDRRSGIAIALLSCLVWYLADSGNAYSHPAIPVWNALIRLGFFLTGGLLVSALRDSLGAAQRLARRDELTGLFTRRAFAERLEHDLAMAGRHQMPLTVAYLDIDDFKAVNDQTGHASGDQLLRTVATALRQSTRQVDTVARLGGDEFALVLPETDAAGACRAIAKLQSGLVVACRDAGFGVSVSIGALTLVAPALSVDEAIAAADALMYEAKRQGKAAVAYRVIDHS